MQYARRKKRLEEQFKEKYKREVVVMSKNDKIDEEKLDEEKLYIQLAGTKPYVGPEESRKRVGLFELNFNINKVRARFMKALSRLPVTTFFLQFVFESGVAEGGKSSSDDLSQQRKKKTVFVSKYPFPYIENRVEVIGVDEVRLLFVLLVAQFSLSHCYFWVRLS